jgi:uncharacterized membrane protein YphA (DoxX/SURF4 family)
MTMVSESRDARHETQTGKAANAALWLLQALVALAFLGAGSAKLMGDATMVSMFDSIGIGQWFRFLTGGLEIVGALMLLTRFTAPIGALLLACVMIGAVVVHLTVMHNSPAGPVVLFVLASVIVWGRRTYLPAMSPAD